MGCSKMRLFAFDLGYWGVDESTYYDNDDEDDDDDVPYLSDATLF